MATGDVARAQEYCMIVSAYKVWLSMMETQLEVRINEAAEYTRASRLNDELLRVERQTQHSQDKTIFWTDEISDQIADAEFYRHTGAIRCPRWLWQAWCYVRILNNETFGREDVTRVLPADDYKAPILLTKSLSPEDAKLMDKPQHMDGGVLLLGLNLKGETVSIPPEWYDAFDSIYSLRLDKKKDILLAEIVHGSQRYTTYGGVSGEVQRGENGADKRMI